MFTKRFNDDSQIMILWDFNDSWSENEKEQDREKLPFSADSHKG